MSDDSIKNTMSITTDQVANASTKESQADTNPSGGIIEGVTQQDFLKLLVNQLEHQDPLDPMNSEEFAVQLAQFTQVEQLIGINKKLETAFSGDNSNAVGSMASFLGNEVVLASQAANIKNGQGPNVFVDMPAGTQSARIDLVDQSGAVAGSVNIDNLDPGKQIVSLAGADVPNGAYEVRAVGVATSGYFVELDAKVTGTVEGFVLEPTPALIVDGEEVALESVKEVYKS